MNRIQRLTFVLFHSNPLNQNSSCCYHHHHHLHRYNNNNKHLSLYPSHHHPSPRHQRSFVTKGVLSTTTTSDSFLLLNKNKQNSRSQQRQPLLFATTRPSFMSEEWDTDKIVMNPTTTTTTTTTTPTISEPQQQHELPSLIDYLIERKQIPTQCNHKNNISSNSSSSYPNEYHIVIGNEAGDADSSISTIAYAYIQDCVTRTTNHASQQPPSQSPPQDSQQQQRLPIISISETDLQTQRPETLFLLQLVGIVPHDHLLFVNTIHEHILCCTNNNDHCAQAEVVDEPINIDVTLVDHNRLNQEQLRKYILKNYSEKNSNHNTTIQQQQLLLLFNVVNIVDHHIDEGCHLDTCRSSSGRRNIAFDVNTNVALVASTCTLLVEMLQEYYGFQNTTNIDHVDVVSSSSSSPQHHLSQLQYRPLPATVSLLLLGVILLDSINMNVPAGKGTIRDRNAIQYLLHSTDWESNNTTKNRLPTDTIQLLFTDVNDDNITTGISQQRQQQPNINLLFETLQNAKFALEFWQSLSVRDALRLDYKVFSTSTVSTTTSTAIAIAATTTTTTIHSSFGISTVLMSFSDFQRKHDFVASVVRDFINDRGITFLCIMLANTNQPPPPGKIETSSGSTGSNNNNNNNLNREIVFIGQNATFIDQMLDYVLITDGTLQLVEIDTIVTTFHGNPMVDTTSLYMRVFQQNNIAASRKQVAPLLMKHFTTTTSASM